jgi:hypothetical protein
MKKIEGFQYKTYEINNAIQFITRMKTLRQVKLPIALNDAKNPKERLKQHEAEMNAVALINDLLRTLLECRCRNMDWLS